LKVLESETNAFTIIAEHHHEKLIMLREGYEAFVKTIDGKFDLVIE
jgi:hypothetical protein